MPWLMRPYWSSPPFRKRRCTRRGKSRKVFYAEVLGIGNAAFEGPSIGEARYILIFKKGKTAVSLSSFFDMKAGGDPFLSQDQLRALAKIVTLRLNSNH